VGKIGGICENSCTAASLKSSTLKIPTYAFAKVARKRMSHPSLYVLAPPLLNSGSAPISMQLQNILSTHHLNKDGFSVGVDTKNR